MKGKVLTRMIVMYLTALLLTSFAVPALAGESLDYSVARGGRLYDKWFKENGSGTPVQPNPLYPATGNYKGKKGADWRCKECHGWDYLGDKGAYKKGKHYTGIKGTRMAAGLDKEQIAKSLRGFHGYDPQMLSATDIKDLTNFLAYGQVDMTSFIDAKTNKASGKPDKGKEYFETLCASCHGMDGRKGDIPPLGPLSNKNPWEVLHKILNGQPAEQMPAMRAFDISVSVDILSYMQSLP